MDVGLVCDACTALTPIGVPQCARCGQPVALDPRPKRVSAQPAAQARNNGASAPAAKAAGVKCAKCGTNVPPNFKFCQICGTRVASTDFSVNIETRVGPRQTPPPDPNQAPGRSTLFFGGTQAARAKLTLIRGDG